MSADDNQNERLNPAFVIGVSIVILGSLFFITALEWFEHPLLIYPDQSMYVAMAQLLLEGKRLYVDMVDFNPPLITYINIFGILTARAFHIPAVQGYNYFVTALILISTSITGVLMFKHRERDESFVYLPVLTAFLFLSQEMVMDFGQREHLVIITYLPFLFLRHLRWNDLPVNKYLAIFCGLYASSCLCLKPHFVAIALLPEFVYFLQKRKWQPLISPETMSATAFGIIYTLHFLFLDPAVRDRFFNFVVPLVKNGYDYYTVSLMKTIADFARNEIYFAVGVVVVGIAASRYCPLIAPVAAFTLGATAIYVLAGQDWSHHLIPIQFGARILFAIEVALLVRVLCSCSNHARLLNIYMSAILLAVATLAFTGFRVQRVLQIATTEKQLDMREIGFSGRSPIDDTDPWGTRVSKYSKPNEGILFISDAIAPGYPITLEMERRPASRYLHGMPIMMAKYLAWEKFGLKDHERFERMLKQILAEYHEDIGRTRPVLIVIRNSAIFETLERMDFFKTDMNDYEKVETFEEHFLYQRKDRIKQ